MTDGELFEEARKIIEVVKENNDKEFDMQRKLLEKVKRIEKECEKNAKENAGNFNVFEIIRIHHLETRMSFFLLELLKKSGTHNMGTAYLKQFFEYVLEFHDVDDNELENAEICWQRKEKTDDKREKRIDMVIKTPYRYIPIEIKIYAGEGEAQCYDYFCIGNKKNQKTKLKDRREWGLFYLTLYGVEPESTKNHEECKDFVHPISWKEYITSWLENLIKITPQNRSNVVEVIKQYRDAIKNLTGQNKEELQVRIEEIINSRETMQAAVAISNALPEIRKNLMKKIFAEINETFNKCPIFQDCSGDHPFLAYRVGTVESKEAKYFLDLSFELDFASEGSCYLCFIVSNEKEHKLDISKEKSEIIAKIKKLICPEKLQDMLGNTSHHYIGYLYVSNVPNFILVKTYQYDSMPDFKKFNQAFCDLFCKDKREKFVKQVAVALNELASWVKE